MYSMGMFYVFCCFGVVNDNNNNNNNSEREHEFLANIPGTYWPADAASVELYNLVNIWPFLPLFSAYLFIFNI